MLNKQDQKNNPEANLTERQAEVLRLIRSGVVSTGNIAESMNIAPIIVSKNIRWLKNKGLDVDSLRKINKMPILPMIPPAPI